MNRRELFRNVGMAAAVVPFVGVREIVNLGKPAPKELPPVYAGQVLTQRTLNDLIDAVNELRAAQ